MSGQGDMKLYRPVVVGLLAVVLSTVFAVRSLSAADWDPTLFTAFGEEATPTRQYAEERLGDVFLRPAQGHDGKFFFVQANDPFVIDPDKHAQVLDRPLYRSQRMFYPILAGGGGALSPTAVVWGLLAVNLIAMGAGSSAVALVAARMGMSPWWGLAAALNPGFISELNISGAGVVAAAAAFGAVALFLYGRIGWAIALLTVAALSREAMLIAAAGTAWWLWRHRREPRTAVLAFTVPLLAVGLWGLYLRLRIGWDSGASEVQEIGVPFAGFVQALRGWLADPIDLAVGVAVMLLFVLYTRRVLRSEHLVGWAFLGFVALGIVFTKQVWQSYFDITRAVAPVLTAFVLLLFAPEREPQRTGVRR